MQEIERKFLVEGKPWKQYTSVKTRHIKQGYISKSRKHTTRIRISSATEAYITIKGPKKGFTCSEFEYTIPVADAEHLMLMCDGDLVEKTRYTFKDESAQRWEVDVFHGHNEGLIVAEIEMISEDTPVVLPSWIRDEVTFDKRYTNSYLSSHTI